MNHCDNRAINDARFDKIVYSNVAEVTQALSMETTISLVHCDGHVRKIEKVLLVCD